MEPTPNLLNVTTNQLQYLATMGRVDTLSQAAAELGISTSALSQALSELERRVGLSLFERRGRARTLNDRGREMLVHAEHILGATRDLTIWATDAIEGRRGAIRLGLIDIAAVGYFPSTLLRFRADRPDVELHLTVAPSGPLVEQLADGRLDLAVIVEPTTPGGAGQPGEPTGRPTTDGLEATGMDVPGQPDLVAVELLVEELAVYAPPGHRVRRTPDQWGPWVTFPPSSHTRQLIAAAVRALGAEFRVEAESHQPEVLRQLVNLGLGWTVLPVLQAEAEPNPLVRARRTPVLSRRLVLVRRRSTPVDPVGAELIERLIGAGRAAGSTAPGPEGGAGTR
ncbi:MAG: LysR family transcriptional regulator [Actinomycetota bacterium]